MEIERGAEVGGPVERGGDPDVQQPGTAGERLRREGLVEPLGGGRGQGDRGLEAQHPGPGVQRGPEIGAGEAAQRDPGAAAGAGAERALAELGGEAGEPDGLVGLGVHEGQSGGAEPQFAAGLAAAVGDRTSREAQAQRAAAVVCGVRAECPLGAEGLGDHTAGGEPGEQGGRDTEAGGAPFDGNLGAAGGLPGGGPDAGRGRGARRGSGADECGGRERESGGGGETASVHAGPRYVM
ncbi:hypothetical protein HEK616_29580 [Streptomyces nigrescens]|uniref:Uncharacterized protein n=1 Tax=Streptomyces nigrescens TaxID=1920 RepID=A0ABM7ZSW5_STRNI|nr:hypothetical protein HEK616_29580 [Streptomyces nigrescens]